MSLLEVRAEFGVALKRGIAKGHFDHQGTGRSSVVGESIVAVIDHFELEARLSTGITNDAKVLKRDGAKLANAGKV